MIRRNVGMRAAQAAAVVAFSLLTFRLEAQVMIETVGGVRENSSLQVVIGFCTDVQTPWQGMMGATFTTSSGSNSLSLSTTVGGSPNCPLNYYHVATPTVTLAAGANYVDVWMDDASGFSEDLEAYFWGVWVTPRGSAETAASGHTSVFKFLVANKTSISHNFQLSTECTGLPFSGCAVLGNNPRMIGGGQSDTVRVQLTAPAGNNQQGTVPLRVRDNIIPQITDTGTVVVTTLTPSLTISPDAGSLSAVPGQQKTWAFTVYNGSAGTVGLTYIHHCPAIWNCSITGPGSVTTNATVNGTLTFNANGSTGTNLPFAVQQTGVTANRDSGEVTVSVATTVDVTGPATLVEPMGASRNASYPVTNTGSAATFSRTVSCSGDLVCGTPTPADGMSLGSTTIVVPYNPGSVGTAPDTIKLLVRQQSEYGNVDSIFTVVSATRSVALSPKNLSMTRTTGVLDSTEVTLTNASAASATFNLTVLTCAGLQGACTLSAASLNASASSSPAPKFWVRYTPGAVGPADTVRVLAQQSNLAANVDTATIIVTASSVAVTLVVTPISGATNRYSSLTPSSEPFTVQNTSSSPVVVTYSRTCNIHVTCTSTPANETISGNTSVVRSISYHSGAIGQTGEIKLTVTESSVPTNNSTGTWTVSFRGPKVRVTPDLPDSSEFSTPGTHIYPFTVHNDTSYSIRYLLSPTWNYGVTSCTPPANLTVAGGASATVNLSCTDVLTDTGWVNLVATDSAAAGNTDAGRRKAIVGTYAVVVTPDAQPLTVPTGAQSQAFKVKTTGTLRAAYVLTHGCTAHVTSCVPPTIPGFVAAGDSTTVSMTYNSGTAGQSGGLAKMYATVFGRTTKDSGWVVVTVGVGNIVASTAINNFENFQPDRCEASCFDVRTALSTAPYFSLDQARSVTLAYNSAAVAVRPVVHVDVSLAAGAPALQEWWLEAKDSLNQAMTFVNGETRLRYAAQSPTTVPIRLSAQFSATQYATGVYPISLVVTAKHTGATPAEVRAIATKFLVINERQSPIAKGWSVAGLSKLKIQGADALIVDGGGDATFFATCGTNCFTTPAGDFSRLTTTGSGGSQVFIRSYPDSSRLEYNNLGRLLRIVSRTLVDTIGFVYDGAGRLTQISDPFRKNGTTRLYTELTYGANGLATIKEPGPWNQQAGGRTVTLTIASSDSTLTQWADSGNVALTKFDYDGSKRLWRLISPRSDTTRFVYNATTWAADTIISERFATVGGGFARLRTKLKAWQSMAVPTGSTAVTAFPAVSVSTIVGTVEEQGGQKVEFSANRYGQPLTVTSIPGGGLVSRITTVYRASSGLVDSVRTFTGAVTKYTYDTNRGLVTKVQPPGIAETNIAYDSFAQISAISQPGGQSQQFVSLSRGRVDTAKVINGAATYKTSYQYDSQFRVKNVSDVGGNVTTIDYETTFGNTYLTTAPGGATSQRWFDGNGRDTAVVIGTLPRRSTRYDALNRVVRRIDAAGTGVFVDTTLFTYGDNQNITSVRDPLGRIYSYVHNSLGQVVQETDPHGASEYSYVDGQGRFITWKSRVANDSVVTAYDNLHRVTEKKVFRGTTLMRTDSYFFDPAGLWIAGHNNVSKDTIITDASGWLTKVITRFSTDETQRIVRDYMKDGFGRLDSVHVTWPGSIGVTGRRYAWSAALGTLDAARLNGSGLTMTYGPDLLPQRLSFPGAIQDTLNFTTKGQPYRSRLNSVILDDALWRSLSYDAIGRIRTTFEKTASEVFKRDFTYDGRGRVTGWRDTTKYYAGGFCEGTPDPHTGGKACTASVTNTFTGSDSVVFDNVANVTILNGVNTTHDINRLQSWPVAGGTATVNHNIGGFRVGRDGAGGGNKWYRWTPDGLLDTVRTPGSVKPRRIKFDYNAFGELVRRRVDSGTVVDVPGLRRHYVWDRGNLLAELDGTLTNRRSEYAHLPGLDSPFAMLTGGTTVTKKRFIHLDMQGNVIGVSDTTGAVTSHTMGIHPWGEPDVWYGQPSVTDTLKLRWNGLLYEADSVQLYYVRARWYDPVTRRFMSEDPIGIDGGINPYVYAGADPMNMEDSDGKRMRCKEVYAYVISGGVNGPPTISWQTKRICWVVASSGGGDRVITVPRDGKGGGSGQPDSQAQAEYSCRALWRTFAADLAVDVLTVGMYRKVQNAFELAKRSQRSDVLVVSPARGIVLTSVHDPNRGRHMNAMRKAHGLHSGAGVVEAGLTVKGWIGDFSSMETAKLIAGIALPPIASMIADAAINGFALAESGCFS